MRRSLVWSLVGIIVVAAASLGATIAAGHSILLGLDLRGGVSVVLKPKSAHVSADTLDQAVNIIDRRVDGLGVSNSNVQREGDEVVISLPGIKNSQSALTTLGTTAQLYFRPVYCAIPAQTSTKPTTSTTKPKAKAKVKAKSAAPILGGVGSTHLLSALLPAASSTSTTTTGTTTTTVPASSSSTAVSPTSKPSEADCSASNAASLATTNPDAITASATVIVPPSADSGLPASERFILGPADLSGTAVKTATAEIPQGSGSYEIEVSFTGTGEKDFDKMAAVRYAVYEQNESDPPYSAQEAIELDGQLESDPVIQAASYPTGASISGDFTEAEANNLALELRYGSLPVEFAPQSVQTVSATIGAASLRAGLIAGIGGILLVMLYMLFYYRALGLVVMVGLGVGGSLLYSILAQLSQSSSLSLTLSGVTGIIVSIGITVDSYIVYFERLKDEVRAGRTIRSSVERSFARAFRTVLTADLVSFMAALILYLLTVGDVKGFAFTLGLSTLLDVFTAYFFIRPAVILVGRRRRFTEAPVFGLARGLGARQSERV